MIDTKNSNQQDDLDGSSSWLLDSQNPTDNNINIFSNLEPEDSEVYLEEWQNKIAMEAHHNGYIKLYHLVFILAKEEGYSDILPKLWEFFHLNREIKLLNGTTISDKENRIPNWIPSWIETAHGRVNPWYWVLLGWTIKPYFHAGGSRLIKSQYFGYIEDEEQDPKKGINLYRFVNRQAKEVNDDEEQSPTHYINLEELRTHIEDIKKSYNLNMPLPTRLFPDQEHKLGTSEEKESQKSISLKKDEYPTHETFIRNLRISYESDSEIKIQEPGRTPTTYHCKRDIRFQDETTEAWKAFLEILQNPDHTYSVGPAYTYSPDGSQKIKERNKSYDRNQKRLKEMNKKLIDFFNKNFQVRIPMNSKLYELSLGLMGVYRFKFQVVNSDTFVEKTPSRYNHYKQDQLIDVIEKLAAENENCRKEVASGKKNEVQISELRLRKGKIDQKLNDAVLIALNKKYLTRAELDKMFAADADKAEIDEMFAAKEGIYDRYENIPDLEPNH